MWWADTTTGLLKQRNAANSAWITICRLSDWAMASVQTQASTRFAAGGTADAITGALAPAITAYAAGLRVSTTPAGANTVTAPTLNLNSVGTKTIKKRDATGSKVALAVTDYNASGPFNFEYDGTDFILLDPLVTQATGATGGGTDKVFWENDQTVDTDYTITTGKNAMSAGPIEISTGVTVTVPSGSTWSIV
jgi:hypothetical protein